MLNKVFVYGTLKRGQDNFALIGELVTAAEAGSIRAELYDLGDYPAIAEGRRLVRGELLTMSDIGEALRRLDRLEDYYGPGDARNEYNRMIVAVRLPDGAKHAAYGYVYADPARLRARGTLLPDGRWPPRR